MLSKTYGPVHLSIIQTLKITSQLEHVARILQLQKSPTDRSVFSFMSEQQDLSCCSLNTVVHQVGCLTLCLIFLHGINKKILKKKDLSSFQLRLTVHLNNKPKYHFAYTLH